jgi:cysteinyl-tRNA synthetase
MRLYNTLGRQVQEFEPQNNSGVKLYTCGPTVYDYAHIGNLRSFVFDDTLRRALQLFGYNVSHVMNITDVGHLIGDSDEGEDKLEAGASRENQSVWDVAQRYIDAFKKDMRLLNVLEPNAYQGKEGPYARATDFIRQQQEIISLLLDGDYAYITDQAVYFDVTKLDDYGKLTGQKLADKEVAARNEVVIDKNKHHPQDFALWFFTKGRFANHSLSWKSQWGEGFPGWHLECSAIIHATLGEPLDIHTGGVDHIGTHHTNEIAQTEAAFGMPLAHYWVHNEHLLVDSQKMSKSLGNYLTLKDTIDRVHSPLALRLLFLQSHYRSQMNFTWEALEAASKNLRSLQALADLRFQATEATKPLAGDYFEKIREAILQDMSNDLSTPAAIARLDTISDKISSTGLHLNNREAFNGLLEFLEDLFGLGLLGSSDISADQKSLIVEREQARLSDDWSHADELRDRLSKSGLEVKDTPAGTFWQRV